MFLKPDSVGIISRGATVWETVSRLRLFNGWRTLVERGTMLLMSSMGRRYNCLGFKTRKLRCTVQREKWGLSLPWVFWHGCPFCMPNRGKPIGNTTETYDRRYEETMERLQKIRYAGYNVVSIWGKSFRKYLPENPVLGNELCSQPYLRNSPINIRDALYGSRTETTKIWYRDEQGEEIRYGDVIILYPFIKCTFVS